MPIYPALALLIGSSLAEGKYFRASSRTLLVVFAGLSVALSTVLLLVLHTPPKGEISEVLAQHPEMYTLSLGHIGDLTLAAFAYLKLPLAIAVVAFLCCAIGLWLSRSDLVKTAGVLTVGMIVFFQAARIALVRFDSYLGSYPLAEALMEKPPGHLIEADAYYAFSSVFFYTNQNALLLNGRINNLEYGSYAPNAPRVFIDDAGFVQRWQSRERYYLLVYGSDLHHYEALAGRNSFHVVAQNSGNFLLCNQE